MKVMLRLLASLAGFLLLAAVPVSAGSSADIIVAETTADGNKESSSSDAAVIARVENYLNTLGTLRARFLQVGTDGAFAEGLFWLQRPGYARFEYAPPVDLLLVADGTWLIFFDAELDQVTHIPIDSGPFRFLLGDHVSFSGDITVEEVEQQRGTIRVRLRDSANPGEGTVTLLFEDKPLRLRQWEMIDAQGTVTAVTLSEIETGLDLDRDLFRFTANDQKKPKFRKGTYR